MRKRGVRLTALILSAVCALSLAGCGREDALNAEIDPDTPIEEVTFPLAETKELSFITSAPATTTQEPNDKLIFQRLEAQTNVHIDWTCFVDDQFADKKNLALAQFGNLPDGLFNAGMSDYDLLRYAKQGIIIPLENLIDKYMPNLQAVFEKYPEYRTMCTAPDGHIYSFPWIEQLGEGKEAIQAIGGIPYINKKWLDFLGLEVPDTVDGLEQVLIAFRDNADRIQQEFQIEGSVIPMSFIINNGDQDPAFLINGFGEGYGDTPDHFAVTDEGEVIYTAVQEGYKEGIQWLHGLVEENLVDPEAFTQEWSTYVAKGKNHRYGLCFTWDIANIDNYEDYVMLPALAGPEGLKNITRQNNSETSGFDRGRCVLTTSCRNTALAAAWIDQMYAPLQSVQNNWGTYGEEGKPNIFEMSTNAEGGPMLKHLSLEGESPVEVRQAQSVNGPLAVLNDYYDVYVTQPDDAKWRLDNMHEIYLDDMHSKYVYPNVFMSIDDTNLVSQYDTDIKKYADQKKADWILNGGIEEEWDEYLQKMEEYGLSDYLAIKQKYFDQYQESMNAG
ncbi:MAG TPA: ABC transporter substrate-binding protein [Candidatus Eisenbergiella merdipullorum]|uniref:ABC transporter substrate-binding protein n=1 Tax=Candidatus Eisenbergiella merdipullorum TaxID=2838553 RepID=A0A9D2I5T4_9FIRM|nr:ABC transporter substrate-binding protein [Candidatus Eisenbergiella merdipullorum]